MAQIDDQNMTRHGISVALVQALLNKPATPVMAVGTGLLALDVVMIGESQYPSRLLAGGTCGNVLTILSFLGWQSYPVARMNGDTASKRVMQDMKKWGVRVEFAKQQPRANTPIIVHEIRRKPTGDPFHKFSWSCPRCTALLPRYKPVPVSAIENVVQAIDEPQVFFFDRVSRGALTLAEACASKGAIVVFEPTCLGDEKLFREALSLAHVVKYAQERAQTFGNVRSAINPMLEIETLGSQGMRFRYSPTGCRKETWRELPPYNISTLTDAAGAGDWCTAGLLHVIGQRGVLGLKKLHLEKIVQALQVGQAMAAWNCGFNGARGGMYYVSREDFSVEVGRIITHAVLSRDARNMEAQITRSISGRICPACN